MKYTSINPIALRKVKIDTILTFLSAIGSNKQNLTIYVSLHTTDWTVYTYVCMYMIFNCFSLKSVIQVLVANAAGINGWLVVGV